jgi:hypothetical protein
MNNHWISEYYKEVTPLGHLIQSGNCPPAFSYTYKSPGPEYLLIREDKLRKLRITTRN